MLSCILVVVLSFEFDLFVLVGSSCFFVILNLVFLQVRKKHIKNIYLKISIYLSELLVWGTSVWHAYSHGSKIEHNTESI